MKKLSIEQKNKIFAGIFIFVFSIYFATTVHEVGHLISDFIFGCKSAELWISPLIFGYEKCTNPQNLVLNSIEKIIYNSSGVLFVSLIGIILLLIYNFSKHIKSYYMLKLILYFFAFNFLLNGFLQSSNSSDRIELIKLGIDPIYIYIFSGIIGFLLLFHVFRFKLMIKTIEPNIKNKNLKMIFILFFILFILICFVYLGLPFILNL